MTSRRYGDAVAELVNIQLPGNIATCLERSRQHLDVRDVMRDHFIPASSTS